jgi:hypothetical protein
MSKLSKIVSLALAAAVSFAATSCATAGDGNGSIESKRRSVLLVWKPTGDYINYAGPSVAAVGLGDISVSVGDGPVWTNIEKKNKPVSFYCDKEQIAKLARTAFSGFYKAADAKYRLNIDVTSFTVTEANMYNGMVTVNLSLADSNGATLWSGTDEGECKRWGRSLSADNFNEAVGSCLSNIVLKSLKDYPELQKYFR